MITKSCFLLLLCFGLTCCQREYAESEHDIKRGTYPYMAYIYYSDPSIVDASGNRFVRSAVLIKPNWLATSALVIDPSFGFPRKTLLARAGAITIDSKFTLNEDEYEQEREVVQIMRPHNHSNTQWWTTDISLIKTLLPFNITAAVDIKNLNSNPDAKYNSCSILVYARKTDDLNEDKNLMMLYVELTLPLIDICGSYFDSNTMACAIVSEENKQAVPNVDFCDGNSGGPLICENEVIGLQTYIGDNCKPPFLYQLIKTWDNFISCAIEDKCQEEQCMHICEANYKDSFKNDTSVTLPITHDTSRNTVELTPSAIDSSGSTDSFRRSEFSVPNASMVPDEWLTYDQSSTVSDSQSSVSVSMSTDNFYASEREEPFPQNKSTVEPYATENDQFWSKEMEKDFLKDTETIKSQEREQRTRPQEAKIARGQEINRLQQTGTAWPRGIETAETKLPGVRDWPKKKGTAWYRDDDENSERPTRVEAQQHQKERKKKVNSTNRNMCVIQTVLFGFIVLLCL